MRATLRVYGADAFAEASHKGDAVLMTLGCALSNFESDSKG